MNRAFLTTLFVLSASIVLAEATPAHARCRADDPDCPPCGYPGCDEPKVPLDNNAEIDSILYTKTFRYSCTELSPYVFFGANGYLTVAVDVPEGARFSRFEVTNTGNNSGISSIEDITPFGTPGPIRATAKIRWWYNAFGGATIGVDVRMLTIGSRPIKVLRDFTRHHDCQGSFEDFVVIPEVWDVIEGLN